MRWWMAVTCIVLVLLAGVADGMSIGEKTKHFDIYYADTTPGGNAGSIGQALESGYSEINGILGTCPTYIKVLVVGKKTMDQVGEHVEAFSAWNNKSSAIVLREETLKDRKSLKVVTEHEICHLGINNILASKNSKDFSWMEEGICMVFSKEPFSEAKVSKYIVSKGFLTPKEISDAVNNENYNVSKNGYMQSYSLIKYIVQRYGEDAIVYMLKCPETDFEKAFLKYTGQDFRSFYPQWQSYVMSTAAGGQAPVRPGYGYLNFALDMADCEA
jgi:hypothetical protein